MLQSFPAQSEQAAAVMAALQAEFKVDRDSARALFVPYRIVPLGAHVDHQGGPVLGRTIPAGTSLAYKPLDVPEIRLISNNFNDRVDFTIGAPVQHDYWARYAQAAAIVLGERYVVTRGFSGAVQGMLLGTGLGSSASVGLAFLMALADVNAISLSNDELIELDYQLEHACLGLDNGIADQSVILKGSETGLILIDTRSREARPIPDPSGVAGSGWLIAYSGVRRELTSDGAFNRRVAECREAAQALEPTAERLGEVSHEQFAANKTTLPEPLKRRATHFFGEVLRVNEGAMVWPVGDLVRFGALMDESCTSSIHQYQSGHRATVTLHNIMSDAPGVYGSRFSGGGHGGCVIGLVESTQAEEASEQIMNRYRQRFPEFARDAAIYWAANGEGR